MVPYDLDLHWDELQEQSAYSAWMFAGPDLGELVTVRRFDVSWQLKHSSDPAEVRGYLNESIDSLRQKNAMGAWGSSMLSSAIYCRIVGLEEQTIALLNYCEILLKAAVDSCERPRVYFLHGTESEHFEDLALARWMLRNEHDAASWDASVVEDDLYVAASGTDNVSTSLALPGYLAARQYQAALDRYHFTGKLKPVKYLEKISTEAQMTYAVCAHYVRSEFDAGSLQDRLLRFMTANMDGWLGNGHAVRAALWMKAAYWDPNPEALTSREALLKVWDHLPGVTPPWERRRPWWNFWG